MEPGLQGSNRVSLAWHSKLTCCPLAARVADGLAPLVPAAPVASPSPIPESPENVARRGLWELLLPSCIMETDQAELQCLDEGVCGSCFAKKVKVVLRWIWWEVERHAVVSNQPRGSSSPSDECARALPTSPMLTHCVPRLIGA